MQLAALIQLLLCITCPLFAEEWYFILVATEQAAYVLMMRKHYKESRSYSKKAVAELLGMGIKDEEDKQWECNTGGDGA